MSSPTPSFQRKASAAFTRARQTLKDAAIVRSASVWIKDMTPKAFAALTRLPRTLKDTGAVRSASAWIRDMTPKASAALKRLARAITIWVRDKTSPVTTRPAPQAPAALEKAPPDSALLLLGLLQKEGRLVDFLHEDIKHYSDQEVGAAARVVHQGCQRVLQEHLRIAPVREEPEGSRVTLEPGFDASAIRPTGNVVGDPPFTGALVHRGWRVIEARLPKVTSGHDLKILAPAEVEL